MKFRNSYEFVNYYLEYVISIDEFIRKFLDGDGDIRYQLTHDEMRLLVENCGKNKLRRTVFSRIKGDDILAGRYLLVKDRNGQVIPYFNPTRNKDLIKVLCNDQVELSRRREKMLAGDSFSKGISCSDLDNSSEVGLGIYKCKKKIINNRY